MAYIPAGLSSPNGLNSIKYTPGWTLEFHGRDISYKNALIH